MVYEHENEKDNYSTSRWNDEEADDSAMVIVYAAVMIWGMFVGYGIGWMVYA